MRLVPQGPRLTYIPPLPSTQIFPEDEVIANVVNSFPSEAPHRDLLKITLTKVYSLRNWGELRKINSSIDISREYAKDECEIYDYFFSHFFCPLYDSIFSAVNDWGSLNKVQRFLLFTYVLSMPSSVIAQNDRLEFIVLKMGDDTYEHLQIINEIHYLKLVLERNPHLLCQSDQAMSAKSYQDCATTFLSFLENQITCKHKGFCQRDMLHQKVIPIQETAAEDAELPRSSPVESEGSGSLEMEGGGFVVSPLTDQSNNESAFCIISSIRGAQEQPTDDLSNGNEVSSLIATGAQGTPLGIRLLDLAIKEANNNSLNQAANALGINLAPNSLNRAEDALGMNLAPNSLNRAANALEMNPAPNRGWVGRLCDWVYGFFQGFF